MRKTIIAMAISACTAWSGANAQAKQDARLEAFKQAANEKGDCTDYPAMAAAVLASPPSGPVHRASAAVAICAARDGWFDLTDRLVAHFPTIAPSFRDYQVSAPYMFMIKHLTDIPGAGPSALLAARRLPEIDELSSPNIRDSELMAMAAFAAGQDLEGIASLDQVDRQGSLSIQTDRRFAPAWMAQEPLLAALDRPERPGVTPVGNGWTRDLAALDRRGEDEATVLAAARRQIAADIANPPSPGDFAPLAMRLTGSNGSSQRSWLVRRLLEDGRIDDAVQTLDLKTIREEKKSADWLFLPGFAGVLEGLIRADRSEEARRLLDWWNAAEAESKVEYVGFSREDLPFQRPVLAIEACLKGEHSARLEAIEWRVALTCNDPEDRTAGLLIDALSSPITRSEALQALSLPPRHASLGKTDDDYRRRWNALLVRPDVSAAIARYGRRLPPETAWRLSRAYPAF